MGVVGASRKLKVKIGTVYDQFLNVNVAGVKKKSVWDADGALLVMLLPVRSSLGLPGAP